MDPKIWGYSGWVFLLSIAKNYPEYSDNINTTIKTKYKTFFYNLSTVLPCSVCCLHYKSHCKTIDIDPYLYNKDYLLEWLLKIHNQVNVSKNIPQLSLNDVSKKYNIDFNDTSLSTDNVFNFWRFIFAVILVYPKNPTYEVKNNYYNFFISLCDIIPIKKKDYCYFVQSNPIDIYLESNEKICNWLIIVFNYLYPNLKFKSFNDAYKYFYNKNYSSLRGNYNYNSNISDSDSDYKLELSLLGITFLGIFLNIK